MTRDELHQLTVAELRRTARRHGVAGASRLRKETLIEAVAAALGLPAAEAVDPRVEALQARTVMQLRRMALDAGVRGAARMNKDTLIELLSERLAEAPSSFVPQPPAPAAPRHEVSFGYPASYGVDRLVLLVRDPEWLYTYWDLSGDTWATLIQRGITNPSNGWRRILRVSDLTGASDGIGRVVIDIELDESVREWYFPAPGNDVVLLVEFGYLSPTGEFLSLLRSNAVQVPRKAPSDQMDERWATLYDEAYRLSLAGGDPRRSMGSAEVMRRLHELLAEGISSAQFGGPVPAGAS